ncbi:salutaridine reductase-like [Phoenix dactylifera]|uniref:Short-chain dehydrogenase/reductase n=1 Tax=Phoenix dactylifera TaxID=42345 RepID=A0A8B8ZT30_PHODC|nr:salutaridine reductase-like [Phoenix dactylifera]
MDGASSTEKRIAVVTGGNKGIGFEICRQLALNGVKVILTARDEKKGMTAVEKLRGSGLFDVIFHQLDVTDPSSISSFADFIRAQFGKLDILVNNAGILGLIIDSKFSSASVPTYDEKIEYTDDVPESFKEFLQETYEMAEECLKTNFYGTKDVTKALIPFLQSSYSGRVVNVSSTLGQLKHFSDEKLKQVLCDIDNLSEEKLIDLSKSFLKDFKEGLLDANKWPTILSAYKVSKVLINSYTRILAKKYPTLCINCAHPGVVKTDANHHVGTMTPEEGARGPVRIALMPDNSSGFFFDQAELSTF